MIMQIHLAMRRILADGWIADPIFPLSLILQGCKFSVSFARETVYDILEAAHSRIFLPGVSLGLHVDDLVQTVILNSKVVLDTARTVALTLARAFVRHGFVVSPKNMLPC